MVEIGKLFAADGWTLRTGGADGSDERFLSGCLLSRPERYELYLPWPRFSKQAPATLERPTPRAGAIAARHHPNWSRLKWSERQLHGRNVHEVLGSGCDDPVKLIVCWTPDGSLDGAASSAGGTGMALRVAAEYAIKVVNLARDDHWNRAAAWVDPRRFDRRERHTQEQLPLGNAGGRLLTSPL